ncbi:MAG: hypothetical protein ACRC4M_05025 [Mycoplasma sp.]
MNKTENKQNSNNVEEITHDEVQQYIKQYRELENEISMLTYGLKKTLYFLKDKDFENFSGMMGRIFQELKIYTSPVIQKLALIESQHINKANVVSKLFRELKLSEVVFDFTNLEHKHLDIHYLTTKIYQTLKKFESERSKNVMKLEIGFRNNNLDKDIWDSITKSIKDEKKVIIKYIKKLWKIDDRFSDLEAKKLKAYKLELVTLFRSVLEMYNIISTAKIPKLSNEVKEMITPLYFTFYSLNYIIDSKN